MQRESNPTNLDTSELGTKEYWDSYYQNDLDAIADTDEVTDPTELESWFDENGAPEKVLEYLTSEDFPLAPANASMARPSVLDLGCGNGSFLFQMVLEGGYEGHMVGVDYSQLSVDLARRLWKRYAADADSGIHTKDIRFERLDLLTDDIRQQSWWPSEGFDLVHDKGTFDAISLSAETFTASDGSRRRVFEQYPSKVAAMVKEGGYLVVTSCNWTEDELVRWFTQIGGMGDVLQVFGRVKYPVYEFGGQQGQGVASVCFRKISTSNSISSTR